MNYLPITEPDTKENLQFVVDQRRKYKYESEWLKEKHGLFSVGIPEDEYFSIYKSPNHKGA